jgi:lantibiotic modifying enzyme
MMDRVREIAAAVAGGPFEPPGNVHPLAAPAWRISLDGLAGQSLLQAYLAFQGAGDAYADAALDLLDQATDATATLHLAPSLYFGFPGVAWVTTHLAGRLFEEEQDSCLDIDELLLGGFAESSQDEKYDLFEGLVGIGAYALERLPRPSGVRLLETVIGHLAARAEHTPEGACFLNSLETLQPKYREMFPHGTYNLGVAHGVAGVISLLGSACRAGIATETARPLLAAAISWLLARELPAESEFRFPNTYTPGMDLERTRLAWCHGDLGIAAALLVAARGAGEPAWEAEALRIARAAAGHSNDATYSPDAGICHGAGGNGHVFNRLFQATGDESLGEAARYWLSRALTFHRPGTGIGGYQMTQKGVGYDHPGFRVGSSGIGLALLAAVSPVEPGWDRLLLIS